MENHRILSIMEGSALFDLSGSFGVVCHDAGGGNKVIAMLQACGLEPAYVCMEGPAKVLWQRAFSDSIPLSSDFNWIDQVSVVLTGTGWASDFEHEARRLSQKLGIRSIAVLDHWANYVERFSRKGTVVLPDELWVVDRYAESLAHQVFPGIPVYLKPDYYAEREVSLIAPIDAQTPNVLLYLLEPVRSDWGLGVAGEFQALRFFLQCIPFLGLPVKTVINLRPHPSEIADKYVEFLDEHNDFPIRMASGSLTDSISASRWVTGCQTYAMTLALRAGRKVFGSLPSWAPCCVLPHKGIVHLKDITVI